LPACLPACLPAGRVQVVLSVRRGFGREMLDYLPTTGDTGRDKDKDAKDGSVRTSSHIALRCF
jgi:hypothetical protein